MSVIGIEATVASMVVVREAVIFAILAVSIGDHGIDRVPVSAMEI